MAEPTAGLVSLAAHSKHVARRLLTIGENRIELFKVEAQEERERLLLAIIFAIGMAVLGLLACMTLSAAIVVLLWPYKPALALLALTGLYGASAFLLWRRLTALSRDWEPFSASMDQLRKDRLWLEKVLT